MKITHSVTLVCAYWLQLFYRTKEDWEIWFWFRPKVVSIVQTFGWWAGVNSPTLWAGQDEGYTAAGCEHNHRCGEKGLQKMWSNSNHEPHHESSADNKAPQFGLRGALNCGRGISQQESLNRVSSPFHTGKTLKKTRLLLAAWVVALGCSQTV